MGYGLSLILIAVGAILTWGVNGSVSGIDIRAVGAILMIVGVIGLAMTVLFWSSFSPLGGGRSSQGGGSGGTTVIQDRPNVVVDRQPTTVVHESSSSPTVVVHDQEPR